MQDIEKVTSFVSIDFETVRGTSSVNGGRYAHLPCAVGICLVLNGVIVQKIYSLINPEIAETSWYCPVAGITSDMCANAPVWTEVFEQIRPCLYSKLPLLAHNHGTEKAVLKEMRSVYEVPDFGTYIGNGKDDEVGMLIIRELELIDTLNILKRMGESGNSLSEACSRHGVELKTAHNALDDAVACAELFLKLQDENIVDAAPSKTNMKKERLEQFKMFGSNKNEKDYSVFECMKDQDKVNNPYTPFIGKCVVFTGFDTDDENTLNNKMYELGSYCMDDVKSGLSYLFPSSKSFSKYGTPGKEAGKLKKAKKFNAQIVTMRELKQMLIECGEYTEDVKEIIEKQLLCN